MSDYVLVSLADLEIKFRRKFVQELLRYQTTEQSLVVFFFDFTFIASELSASEDIRKLFNQLGTLSNYAFMKLAFQAEKRDLGTLWYRGQRVAEGPPLNTVIVDGVVLQRGEIWSEMV